MPSGTIEHSKKPNEDEPKVTKDEQRLQEVELAYFFTWLNFQDQIYPMQ